MTIVDIEDIAEISHQKNITDILTKDIIAIKAIMDIKDFKYISHQGRSHGRRDHRQY